MKKSVILLATIGLPLGALHAQTVPLIINYQGRVTSGTGAPLGATGTAPNFIAAPENRKVIFRLFDAQTGGNRLWSEEQNVTISLGEFSVLLGQGNDAVYDSVQESRPALDTAFTGGGAVPPSGPVRYLEIVVDDGNGTFTAGADAPITPRQRITTTAYSFRSRIADAVSNLGIATPALADGAVTAAKVADNSITALKILDGSVSTAKIPDSAITSLKIADGTVGNADLANNAVNTAKIADNSVTAGKMAANSVTGANIVDGAITDADLASNSVTAAKLDPATVGFWSVNGGNVFRAAGSVGIGTNAPSTALTVRTAGEQYGFEHTDGNRRLRTFLGGSNGGAWIGTDSNHPLTFYTNGSGTRLTISAAGNVGIGTSNPVDWLHLAGLNGNTERALRIDDGAGRFIRMYRSPSGFVIAGNSLGNAGGGSALTQWDGDGNWDALSDRTLKKDITDAESVLDRLMELPVRRYRWKDRPADVPPSFGVIAQEVKPLFPDVVGSTLLEGATKENMTVKYGAFGLIAAKAVQELKQEKDAEVKALQDENAGLRARLAALEANDKTREARLATIENLLISAGKNPARTVSLKAGE